MADTWYAFECVNEECPVCEKGGTEVLVDVRIADILAGQVMPDVRCPLCRDRMNLTGMWPATDMGHGSRADAQQWTRDRIVEAFVSDPDLVQLTMQSLQHRKMATPWKKVEAHEELVNRGIRRTYHRHSLPGMEFVASVVERNDGKFSGWVKKPGGSNYEELDLSDSARWAKKRADEILREEGWTLYPLDVG